MNELINIIREALPEAIGGLATAAIITLLGLVYRRMIQKKKNEIENKITKPVKELNLEENKMDIPQQIAITTIGMAIKFLFDEAHLILQERRKDRVKMEDTLIESMETETQSIIDSKKLIIRKALAIPLNSDIEREIKLLLDLIDTEKKNRDRAKKQIALQGGIAFANPPTIASRELAEEKIMEHSVAIKKLLEDFYGIKIIGLFSDQE